MTTVYFVRNAQPDEKWQENITRPLTEAGIADSNLVTEFFQDIPLDAVFSSPFKIIIETVGGAAIAHNLTVITDNRLSGLDTYSSNNSIEMLRSLFHDLSFHEEGKESIKMVQDRTVDVLKDILTEYADKTVVIGIHGLNLGAVLNYFNPDFNFDEYIKMNDWMPYIMEFDFEKINLLEIKAHCYICKNSNGNINL